MEENIVMACSQDLCDRDEQVIAFVPALRTIFRCNETNVESCFIFFVTVFLRRTGRAGRYHATEEIFDFLRRAHALAQQVIVADFLCTQQISYDYLLRKGMC